MTKRKKNTLIPPIAHDSVLAQDPDVPIPYAFRQLDWPVACWVVSIGTLFGLSTSLIGAMFPLPRIGEVVLKVSSSYFFYSELHDRCIVCGCFASFLLILQLIVH